MLEVIGRQTGWGYELANIIIFVVIQPALIILFFVLWVSEMSKASKTDSLEVQQRQKAKGHQ